MRKIPKQAVLNSMRYSLVRETREPALSHHIWPWSSPQRPHRHQQDPEGSPTGITREEEVQHRQQLATLSYSERQGPLTPDEGIRIVEDEQGTRAI